MRKGSFIELLKEVIAKEDTFGMYDIKVGKLTMWRFFRSRELNAYLSRSVESYQSMTQKRHLKLAKEFWWFIKVPFTLLRLVLMPTKKNNAIFAMPRLAKFGNTFIDKFTDPVREETNLAAQSLVFQKEVKGVYYGSRYKGGEVVSIKGLWIWMAFLGVVLSPFILLFVGGRVWQLYQKCKQLLNVGITFYPKAIVLLSMALIEIEIWKIILKRGGFRQLFVVNREAHMIPLIAAKKIGVKVFEFQHGATLTETVLYSGRYDMRMDPDQFLIFGEKWRGTQFGISVDRIVNIGWALPLLTARLSQSVASPRKENSVLLISAPHSTNPLLQLAIAWAKEFPETDFYLRLHPQEGYSQEQTSRLEMEQNLFLDDTKIDSSQAIMRYPMVMGVCSTVLFEALEYDKPVGLVTYNGVESDEAFEAVEEFFKIAKPSDVTCFLKERDKDTKLKKSNGYYDTFDAEKVNNLIKK